MMRRYLVRRLVYLIVVLFGVSVLAFGLGRLATGDPVARAVGETLPLALELAGTAFLLSLLLGVPLGVVAAARSWTWVDHLVRVVIMAGASIPAFWLGYLLILLFSVTLHVLPSF